MIKFSPSSELRTSRAELPNSDDDAFFTSVEALSSDDEAFSLGVEAFNSSVEALSSGDEAWRLIGGAPISDDGPLNSSGCLTSPRMHFAYPGDSQT